MAIATDLFDRQVRDALAHLEDLPHLQTHPLTRVIRPVSADRAGGSGMFLQTALLEAIERLRPDSRLSSQSSLRRHHQILDLRYTQGMTAPAVQARLGIAKSQYYRQHQEALAAVVSALRERWPPLGSARPAPGNDAAPYQIGAPQPLTPLIGRESDLAEVERLLRASHLVTLVGPPGTGKTRLALEVAQRVTGYFPDGVAFVALAAIEDPSLVLPSIALTVGAKERPGADAHASLATHLAGKRMLMVLDNFEQVVEAAARIGELLQRCATLRVLVTSRILLQVRGERAVPVAPLAVPADTSCANVVASPAGRLFVERAQEHNPSFCLTDQSAPAVAAICRRLDGLPLALELAAAWADTLPVDAILAGLVQPLAFLTAGPRDLPPHQRTLQDAIAWSYGLLEPAAQRLFARLAVFVGGWDLAAANQILGALDDNVVRGLSDLIRSSLVRAVPCPNGLRYDMLETIRGFALARLGDDPEASAIWRRHADYYLALSAGSEWRPSFPSDVEWMQRIPQEEANLRAAFTWALSHGDRETALRLAAPLAHLCQIGGRYSEGRELIVGTLELPTTAGPTQADVLARYRLGEVELFAGDLPAAQSAQQKALDIAEDLGDARAVAYCLFSLQQTLGRLGRHEEAHDLEIRELRLFREVGDPAGIAMALEGLGAWALGAGDLAAARAYLEEGLATAEIMHIYCYLGLVALEEGKVTEAREHFGTYLRRAHAIDLKDGIAQGLEGFASIAAASGQAPRATCLAAAADALRELTGAPLSPYQREQLDRRLRPAADALSGPAYEVAWNEGRRMATDDAIAYALET